MGSEIGGELVTGMWRRLEGDGRGRGSYDVCNF